LCLEKWSHGGGEAGAALGGGARQGGGRQKGRRWPRCFRLKEEEGSGGQVGHLGRASYQVKWARVVGWWARRLGLVAGQGRMGGLWPGRLIWAERRWHIFCGVRILEGKAVFLEIHFHSRDTCSIRGAGVLGWQASWATHCDCATWAMNESGEVGQPGRKGRRGPG
jgi:hypothetical protein